MGEVTVGEVTAVTTDPSSQVYLCLSFFSVLLFLGSIKSFVL